MGSVTIPPPSSPPASWYPDPSNPAQLRYWDGTEWTAHTAPQQPTRSDLPLGPGGRPYASFWRRLSGLIIDDIALAPVMVGLFALSFGKAVTAMVESISSLPPDASQAEVQRRTEEMMAYFPSGQELLGFILITSAVTLLYFGVCLHLWGCTLGGFLVGIRCVNEEGTNPSWHQSFVRQAVVSGLSIASAIPLIGLLASVLTFVNYLSMLSNPRRQAWMDRAASTFVVRV